MNSQFNRIIYDILCEAALRLMYDASETDVVAFVQKEFDELMGTNSPIVRNVSMNTETNTLTWTATTREAINMIVIDATIGEEKE